MYPHGREQAAARMEAQYPFARGRFPVGVRTIQAFDCGREREFSIEVWYPAAPASGVYPLIVYSHHSGGNRRSATYLCSHLSSYGYLVAAVDHSTTSVAELTAMARETPEERAARVDAAIASRVPDVAFLLDYVTGPEWDSEIKPDPARIGAIGHSFGGWTVLAAPEKDARIGAVVALAPAGASNPLPGVIPVKLTFEWQRSVPTLYLVAENDTPLPLPGMYELFERTAAPKRLVALRRADHLHFIDNAAEEHEKFRSMPRIGAEWEWMADQMRPMGELCSEEEARAFVRGLALCHFDAVLKGDGEAKRFLEKDLEAGLAASGISAAVHRHEGTGSR